MENQKKRFQASRVKSPEPYHAVEKKFCCYPPVCGEAGDAGSMTAVPSSAMRSWRARLGCSGERGGERAPLSLPLARRGSFRSRGSSRESMATNC